MILEIDFNSDEAIYVQLRNQIVKGIGKGELKAGEKLPTVRQLAFDAGVNTMTVNKCIPTGHSGVQQCGRCAG